MRDLVVAAVVVALLAGCLTHSSPAAPAGDAGRQGRDAGVHGDGNVTTVKRSASWAAGVNAAGESPSFVGTGMPVESVPAQNLTGVVVEMQWTPVSPLSERMSLHVWDYNTGKDVGAVAGTSPLRLVLEGTKGAGKLVLEGDADKDGAQAGQGYDVYLTSFHGVPFDASFSALPH